MHRCLVRFQRSQIKVGHADFAENKPNLLALARFLLCKSWLCASELWCCLNMGIIFWNAQDILEKFEFFPVKCRVQRALEVIGAYCILRLLLLLLLLLAAAAAGWWCWWWRCNNFEFVSADVCQTARRKQSSHSCTIQAKSKFPSM